MNKYINTFPLDDQAILQIQQDIEGMAQEAQEREEPLEQMLGKNPRESAIKMSPAIIPKAPSV